jgi:hypothetical protein|tara:strand:- start:1500 stop:1700 length:201 start_codon:yes stop_codon:yes gene_type:complete
MFESSQEKILPDIPKNLLEELDARFPEKCPSIDEDDRSIWVYAGQRSVVKLLWEHYNRSLEQQIGY